VKVLLLQLDGKLPNVALMRLAAHHRAQGDEVTLLRAPNRGSLKKAKWAGDLTDGYHRVFGSLIFERTRELAGKVREVYPGAILGGTGWPEGGSLEGRGVGKEQDYSIYPEFTASIGFTQRGCRLRCPFCVVPKKEGKNRHELAVTELWRGEGHPKHLLLLDNDFFGQEGWREKAEAMREGEFRVCFSQGINVRLFDQEAAEVLGTLDCRDDQFRRRRIYTAWDNKKDEQRLFAGLDLLTKVAGFKPDQIMVYMLIGYWPGETQEDRLYRQKKLREYGCRPYPMPFRRTPELVGFQRWCISSCDKRVPWDVWEKARYQPRNLHKVKA
jgi:hypothetical protein